MAFPDRYDQEELHRLDSLEMPLAEGLEDERGPVPEPSPDVFADHDLSWFGLGLDPLGAVDTVTIDVAVRRHCYVSQVDAGPQALANLPVEGGRRLERGFGARRLEKSRIADELDDAPLRARDRRLDDPLEPLNESDGLVLIPGGKAAVAHKVGEPDDRKAMGEAGRRFGHDVEGTTERVGSLGQGYQVRFSPRSGCGSSLRRRERWQPTRPPGSSRP